MKAHYGCMAGLLLALTACGPAYGGSLRTRFTTVTLKDLPIGKWTRIELADGTRYAIENATDRTVRVGIEAIRPFDKDKKASPYRCIPDLSWVKVKPATLTLKPGQTGTADVAISVPDKPEYAARKYRFWIRAKTLDGQFAVGLLTRVRFNTVPAEPSAAAEGDGAGSRENDGAAP